MAIFHWDTIDLQSGRLILKWPGHSCDRPYEVRSAPTNVVERYKVSHKWGDSATVKMVNGKPVIEFDQKK